jgi:hypothetical protein
MNQALYAHMNNKRKMKKKNRKIKHACHPVVVDNIAGKKITFIG